MERVDRLEELAEKLMSCRKRGNKLTLQCVLESARVLEEAKDIAKNDFRRWLTEQGRMDYSTAARHLRVARFARNHVALMPQIVTLGMVKVYALSSIDSGLAARVLTGQIKFSAPLEEICDLQFRREFREKFPPKTRKHTREHVYQSTASALTRAVDAVQEASMFFRKMTASQRQRIVNRIHTLVKLISNWNQVA